MQKSFHPFSLFLDHVRHKVWSGLLIALASFGPMHQARAQSDRVVITPATGFGIIWDGNNGGFSNPEPGATAPDNDALASKGVVAFGSSAFQPGGIHDWVNVNDGYYGNSSSWIPDFAASPPDTARFVGLSFGKSVSVRSVSWSRDNGDAAEQGCGGTCTDRAVGIYEIQITRVANPDASTASTEDAATGWQSIGTVEYKAGLDTAAFRAYLRHRFDISQDGQPVAATGLRIVVSDSGICIDEIDVNPPADPIPPLNSFMTISNAPQYAITWDLNDGKLYDAGSPARAPRNRALASRGTTAFGSSEYGSGVHWITNVNDGLYGNSHSWIANFASTPADPTPFIGLRFGAAIELKNIAWSRDNGDDTDCCGGELSDRALGRYVVQITRVAEPGVTTSETGDPTSGWVTVGQIDYRSAGAVFTPHRRHRFDLATDQGQAVVATGIRLKVPNVNTAIDEIEINVAAALEQDVSSNITLTPSEGYTLEWDGNDGDFYSAAAGARSPSHAGLAASGATALGSSELGYGIHFITKINDGLYGNSSSWISDQGLGAGQDADPFVGIRFASSTPITTFAFGRDNGDTTEGGCGGTCEDRSLGIYTIQITSVTNPGKETPETGDAASGWETVATIEYVSAAPPGFNPSRRHAYSVSRGGNPVPATGFRIKVSSGSLAIDEIEINPADSTVAPPLSDLIEIQSIAGYSITWDGNEGEFTSPDAAPPARGNAALASRGGIAFGSSEVDLGVHFIRNINDGIYGNAHSWIGKFTDPPDTAPFVGIRLPQLMPIRRIAFGRDNGDATDCCGGTLTDRALGVYTIQITRVIEPGRDTSETGDPGTGWATIGTISYKAAAANQFTPHLRHRFDLDGGGLPITATGVRVKVSGNEMAIDELEINPEAVIDQNVLLITPEAGFSVLWDGNNGDYSTTNSPARVPSNAALATNGAVAFGSTEVNLGTHFITNINDGLYGNAHSWIADFVNGDSDPWVGVRFGSPVLVSTIAWGRDNSRALTDRAGGTYTLQFTEVSNPGIDTAETGDAATGWAPIARLEYRGAGTVAFRQHLRHEYQLARDGAAFRASAVRIKVSSPQMDIDEIEVNTVPPRIEAGDGTLVVERTSQGTILRWTGTGVLEERDDLISGSWRETGLSSPATLQLSGSRRFYRLK